MKIAIQGLRGSFHHEAAAILVRDAPLELVECSSFRDVFAAVHSGAAERGIAAVENNLYGSINAVYALLQRHDLWIGAETTLRVNQYLIAGRPQPVAGLNRPDVTVVSQIMALAQCEQWLDTNLPLAVRRELHDTTASVQLAVGDGRHIAIAGKHAAEIYGGHVIAGPINDDPDNFTRFVLLQKEHAPAPDANRTAIILKTDHTPGALYRALTGFAAHDINLSKLDSHPIAGDARHYAFYIDYDAGVNSKPSQIALAGLAAHGFSVKILGSWHA